jgi:hypothetical protein
VSDQAALISPAATLGVSWDFNKIPLLAPDRAMRSQARTSLVAPVLPGFMQPKLAIGEVNDPLEHEADRFADLVMRMPDPRVLPTAAPQIKRKCTACDDEEHKTLQMKTAGTTRSAGGPPPIVHQVLRSPGEQLGASTRAFFEPRYGHDFSQVRIHADEKAAESARAVNALAYTSGQHVVFGRRQYAPHTAEGKRLLAHELTHVLQHRQSSVPWTDMQQRDPMSVHVTHTGCGLLQLQQAAIKRNVTSIDVITGPSQSTLTSFPAIDGNPDCNLNAPGAVNNTTTGTCLNIQQIHFHLTGIPAPEVLLLRVVERTTLSHGQTETINKSDGPSPELVARPNDSLIAVADCPGALVVAANPAAFPISYHAHFVLTAFDSINMAPLAKISYDVTIDKMTINDASPTNTLSVTDQKIF